MGEMGDSSYNFRPTSSTCIWGVGSNPVVNIYILIFLLSHLQAVAALLCQTISMTSEKRGYMISRVPSHSENQQNCIIFFLTRAERYGRYQVVACEPVCHGLLLLLSYLGLESYSADLSS